MEVSLGPEATTDASAIAGLRDAARAFSAEPYLLTVSARGAPHCGTVRVDWDEAAGCLLLSPPPSGWAGTAAAGHTEVSVLWPPDQPGGYSLIVDGPATAGPRGEALLLTPTKAVLHRRATPAGTGAVAARAGTASTSPATNLAEACGSDCVPLLRRPATH